MLSIKKNLIKNKKVYLFGSGILAKKTITKFSEIKFQGIIDNSKNLKGQTYMNLPIISPKNINKKNFYVITSTSFSDISRQLISKGLEKDKNFILTPFLNDLETLSDLEELEQKILFTSGSPSQQSSLYGGGLYLLNLKKDSWKYKKILSGNCYGSYKSKNKIFVIDENRGVIQFNKNLTIDKIFKIEKGIRPHGISFCEKTRNFFICCTEMDSIFVYDINFKKLDIIPISSKKEKTGIKHHHINDCAVIDGSLFVSMFSISGNYNKEFYDGTIIEINTSDFTRKNILTNKLWMPHNISFFDNSLHVLNSFKGELLAYNMSVIGKFPAFARGLDFKDGYYYVGQSRNRNFSKLLGNSLNTSIDSGIIIFESKNKLSRFLQLHPKLSEIHSIMLI